MNQLLGVAWTPLDHCRWNRKLNRVWSGVEWSGVEWSGVEWSVRAELWMHDGWRVPEENGPHDQ